MTTKLDYQNVVRVVNAPWTIRVWLTRELVGPVPEMDQAIVRPAVIAVFDAIKRARQDGRLLTTNALDIAERIMNEVGRSYNRIAAIEVMKDDQGVVIYRDWP